MALRIREELAVPLNVVRPVTRFLEIRSCTEIEMPDAAMKSKRVQTNAPLRPEDRRPLAVVQMGAPRLHDVERAVSRKPHHPTAQLFDVVARSFAPPLGHGDLLVSLAADA